MMDFSFLQIQSEAYYSYKHMHNMGPLKWSSILILVFTHTNIPQRPLKHIDGITLLLFYLVIIQVWGVWLNWDPDTLPSCLIFLSVSSGSNSSVKMSEKTSSARDKERERDKEKGGGSEGGAAGGGGKEAEKRKRSRTADKLLSSSNPASPGGAKRRRTWKKNTDQENVCVMERLKGWYWLVRLIIRRGCS